MGRTGEVRTIENDSKGTRYRVVTTSPRLLSPQPQLTPQGGTGSTMTMARSLPQLPLPQAQ